MQIKRIECPKCHTDMRILKHSVRCKCGTKMKSKVS